MSPSPRSEDSSPSVLTEIPALTSFTALVKSWFVRFYDHLITLVGLNAIWFLACVGLPYALLHWGGILSPGGWRPWLWVGVFLWDLATTLAVARSVFLLLNEGVLQWEQFQAGIPVWGLKAGALFLIWAGIAFLGGFNLYFYLHWHPGTKVLQWLLGALVVWFLAFWAACFFYLWPVLFFQNPTLGRTFYKSFLLVLEAPGLALALLALEGVFFLLFCLVPAAWALLGFVFFFSFHCMLLEKRLLRYKITYQDKNYDDWVEVLAQENQRGWRYFLKPWENR